MGTCEVCSSICLDECRFDPLDVSALEDASGMSSSFRGLWLQEKDESPVYLCTMHMHMPCGLNLTLILTSKP
jgi:hypothetical protein